MSRKLGLTAASAVLALTLAACGGEGAGSNSGSGGGSDSEDLSIGVSMPTQTSERWIADGDAVKAQLEDEGYRSTCSSRATTSRPSPSRSTR